MKQNRKARKKQASAKVSPGGPIRFALGGELHLRGNSVPIRIALPRGDHCMGVLWVSPLSPADRNVCQAIPAHRKVLLRAGGCDISAWVARKADKSGSFLVYAADVLHGLARPVSLIDDSHIYSGEEHDAKVRANRDE